MTDRPFCRVILKPDAWTHDSSVEGRAADFRGNATDDISVAHTAACPPETVLAAFYGSRSGAGPAGDAYYYSFRESEVLSAGGALQKTPAEPPWPQEYNDAHHDICKEHMAVASHMAGAHVEEPSRVSAVPRNKLLAYIANLLGRAELHDLFKLFAWKRFNRLFLQERELWIQIALEQKHLLYHKDITSKIRGLRNKQPDQFESLARVFPELHRERVFRDG